MDAIFSIKPHYAELILSGVKRYEYRRTLMRETVDKVYIYATAPVKKVVGYFTIKKVISDHPLEVWRKTYKYGGIEQQDYQDYFNGKTKAYAYEIDKVVKFDEPIEYKEIDKKGVVPMSYKYLRGD